MLSEILQTSLVRSQMPGTSKKRVLEDIADIAHHHNPRISKLGCFKKLVAREQLGSTALGDNVAIPHCRLEGISSIVGCFITLDKGVDFEAPDDEDVDIIFALLVPENEQDAHLDALAILANIFSKPQARAELREAKSDAHLFETLLRHAPRNWHELTL